MLFDDGQLINDGSQWSRMVDDGWYWLEEVDHGSWQLEMAVKMIKMFVNDEIHDC